MNIFLIFLLIGSPALASDKKKECKSGFSLNYNKECVQEVRESCTHSCYRHKCGYGFHMGKYKYHCGYQHDSSCPGHRTVTKRDDGLTLSRGICH